MGQVFYTELPAHLRLTLLALADFADNDGGSIHVGQRHLAVRTGAGERTIRRNLKALVDAGYITETGRTRGGVNKYQLALDRLPSSDDIAAMKAEIRQSPPANMAGPGVAEEEVDRTPTSGEAVTHVRPNRTPTSAYPSVEPSVEPSALSPSELRSSGEPSTIVVDERSVENLMFEAICVAFGIDWTQLPPRSPTRGVINATIPELRGAGVLPGDVVDLVAWLGTSADSPLVSGRRLTIGSLGKWAPYWAARPLIVQRAEAGDADADAVAIEAVHRRLGTAPNTSAAALPTAALEDVEAGDPGDRGSSTTAVERRVTNPEAAGSSPAPGNQGRPAPVSTTPTGAGP